MSNDLFFAADDDQGLPTPPMAAVAEPDASASSLSLSLGLEPMEEESPPRVFFWMPSGRAPYLHKQVPGLLDGQAKATYETLVRTPGAIDWTTSGAFAYEFTKGGAKKYRTYPLDVLLTSIRVGDINHVHEAFFPGMPVKPFFDIDRKLLEDEILTERDVLTYIRKFLRHLTKTCGFSEDESQWRFMETIHEKKFSLHAVLNDGCHFADANALFRYMVTAGVDFKKYHIDAGVYAAGGSSLRMLGSSHFGRDDVCFLRGVMNTRVTRQILHECLAQRVPEGSKLIEVAPSNYVRGPMRKFQGDYAQCINPVLDLMRELGNDDVRASAIGYDRELERVTFDLDNAPRCRFKNHEMSVQCCFVNPLNMVCLKKCRGCDCPDELFGLTQDAIRFMRQRNYLEFIRLHGLCRVDMFLFHDTPGQRTYGRYDLTPEEFWAKQRRPSSCRCVFCQTPDMELPPDFCEFDVAKDGGSLMSIEFFNFVRDFNRESEALMAAYIALFVTHNTETGTIYFRGTKGVISVAKEWITAELAKYKRYHYEWKGPVKEKYEVKSEKPFYPGYFVGTAHFKPIQYTTTGCFELTRDSPLNLCPPKAIDTNAAIRAWQQASPADRECIKAVWMTLLEMVCEYEPRGNNHNIKCRQQFQRWFMEVCFRVGIPTNVMMLMMSDEGGIGKSTIPTIIARNLGALLYCEPGSCKMFFETQFNSNTNCFVNFDEIVCKGDLVEKVKQAITAKFIRLEEKFKKPFMADNARNIYASTNLKTFAPINENGFERRVVVHKILPKKVLEELGLFQYRCLHCEHQRDADGELIACKHDYVDHRSWSDLLYDGVINGDELRLPFFGYLAEMFREQSPTWTCSLQASMICTRATADIQNQKQSIVAKVIDEFNGRGFHWSPFLNPKINTESWHRAADIPRLGSAGMQTWEDKVVFGNLYQAIRAECIASGVQHIPTKETVIDDLTTLSMSRMQKPLVWTDEVCTLLTYTRQFETNNMGGRVLGAPAWENTGKTAMCRVLDMGQVPWFKPDNTALPARKQLARSETFGSMSLGESSNSLPEAPPEDTNMVAEGAKERRKKRLTIVDIVHAVDDDAARDAEEFRLAKARKIQEDPDAEVMASKSDDEEDDEEEEAEEAPWGIDTAMEGEEED